MVTNVWLSAFFVVLAIVLFIVMCYKGFHTGLAAIVSAIVAAFGSTNTFMVSMFSLFPQSVGNLVINMFSIFTVSGLLSKMLEDTGCSMAVGTKMIKWLGVDRAYLAISATAVILKLAGVGTFMYIVVIVAMPLMKAANLPRRVGLIAAQGLSPALSFCMPVASMPAAIPNSYLGTNIYSAPVLSVATGCVGIALFFLYINHVVKQCRQKGIGYDGKEEVKAYDVEAQGTENLPNFWTSVIPLISIAVVAILMTIFTKIDSTAVVVIAQLLACVMIFVFHYPRCKKAGLVQMFSKGTTSMWGGLVMAACVFAFGQVVCTCAAFETIQNWVLGLQINPYVSAMVSIAVVAGLCADGISAMMVWLPLFSESYLAMGVNAGALRRLLLCTSQTFDSLPHSQSVAITLSLFNMSHKEGYKDMFVITVIFPVIFSIFCCICCIIFYPV